MVLKFVSVNVHSILIKKLNSKKSGSLQTTLEKHTASKILKF
jgi:hypothetical protein